MTGQERAELASLRESMHELAVEVARLAEQIEPLVRGQPEVAALRDRVAQVEGFRAAVLWLSGLVSAGAVLRFVMSLWVGGSAP